MISFFVHDLSSNPVGRVLPLARALQPDFEIEILGLLIGDSAVYPPYHRGARYKTLKVEPSPWKVLASLAELASMASGDIIYAAKPMPTTLIPACLAAGCSPAEWSLIGQELMRSVGEYHGDSLEEHQALGLRLASWGRSRKKPLLLDVDDDEWSIQRSVECDHLVRLLHPLALSVDAVSVATRSMQQRHGGTMIFHGPDERVFNPDAACLLNRFGLRQQFGLPEQGAIALFAGSPRPHKGLEILRAALHMDLCRKWRIALIGDPSEPEYEDMKATLGPRCHLLGFRPHFNMPALLRAVDAAVIPQRDTPVSVGQTPAKLLDAMAMACPVVTTWVGDLPEILGGGSRGYLARPGDPVSLAEALAATVNEPAEAARRGQAARQWYLNHASRAAIREKLGGLIAAAEGLSSVSRPGRAPVPAERAIVERRAV